MYVLTPERSRNETSHTVTVLYFTLQAKDCGQLENKWLMINIQNVQDFACQCLNRDVWSNDAVKTIIREHFIFWQVTHHHHHASSGYCVRLVFVTSHLLHCYIRGEPNFVTDASRFET